LQPFNFSCLKNVPTGTSHEMAKALSYYDDNFMDESYGYSEMSGSRRQDIVRSFATIRVYNQGSVPGIAVAHTKQIIK
jgi:hypothetical protein